jgi:hypothetical protein
MATSHLADHFVSMKRKAENVDEELFEGNLKMSRERAAVDDSLSRDLLSAFRIILHMHGDQGAAMFEIQHLADETNTRTLSVSKLSTFE